MLGLLSDDEGETFEDGLIPISFEVDDHVSDLGEVEFYPIVGLSGARELLLYRGGGREREREVPKDIGDGKCQ